MARKVLFELTTVLMLIVFSGILQVQPVNAQPRQQRERAQRLATEGDNFYRQKNYRSAIDRYAQAIALAPNYPYAYYYKGNAHYSLGEYDQAVSDFTKALEQGYNKPIDVYTMRWQANYWRKNYDAALNDAQAGLRLQPSSSYFNLAVGDAYRGKSDFRNAVNYYKKGASLDTSNADIHYFIAVCHNQLGEYVEQGLAASEALRKGTKYKGESWEYLGQAYQFARKYEEAAKAYEQALAAKPDMRETYTNLSEVYRILNRFGDAINTVNRSLRLYPNDGNSYISLSWYYSLADQHQDAVTAAQTATKLLPNQYMGYTNLCRAYNDLKQFNQAIQSCTRALQLNPGDGETNLYLARAYDFQNKTALAAATYKKAVDGLVAYTRSNPDYSDGFYLLGNAYYATDQLANAITAYKKCLDLAPNFTKARYNLGYIYVKSGNKALAREQYNALRSLDADLAAKLLAAINK